MYRMPHFTALPTLSVAGEDDEDDAEVDMDLSGAAAALSLCVHGVATVVDPGSPDTRFSGGRDPPRRLRARSAGRQVQPRPGPPRHQSPRRVRVDAPRMPRWLESSRPTVAARRGDRLGRRRGRRRLPSRADERLWPARSNGRSTVARACAVCRLMAASGFPGILEVYKFQGCGSNTVTSRNS